MLALLNTVMNNCLKVLLMTQSKVDLNVREREKISRITENFTTHKQFLLKNIHIQRGSINMHAWVVKGPDSIEGKKIDL